MGSYTEVFGALVMRTSEAADNMRKSLAERGYLEEGAQPEIGGDAIHWKGENDEYTPALGHCIYFNGGVMKNCVLAVNELLAEYSGDVDADRTVLRGTKYDGDFALYEFNGSRLCRKDDLLISDIIDGFSWEAWDSAQKSANTSGFAEQGDDWLLEIESDAYAQVEMEEKINALKAWAVCVGYRLDYRMNSKMPETYNAYSRLPSHGAGRCIKVHLYKTPLEAVSAAASWLFGSYKKARAVALPVLTDQAA